ncbi:energy transducer TonB [Roseivirga sp.]|uniref:energy transducer TonB n=1 Tax=Roseivirga sp. TaxID=1964215 RepID=UPI003B8D0AAA
MSKPRKDKPLNMPRYRGGDEALKKFVDEHLKYPKEAVLAKVEGPVEVSYSVDGLGRVSNVQVIHSLGYGCDEEVIRLVKLLKFEKAYNKGRAVTAHKKLKIDFKLPKKKEQKLAINYTITASEKPKTDSKKISYKISI